jgi:hypothetical protein
MARTKHGRLSAFFFVSYRVSLHLGKAPRKQLAAKSSAARKTAVSLTRDPFVVRY